jgi:hypothetical protein
MPGRPPGSDAHATSTSSPTSRQVSRSLNLPPQHPRRSQPPPYPRLPPRRETLGIDPTIVVKLLNLNVVATPPFPSVFLAGVAILLAILLQPHVNTTPQYAPHPSP